MNSDFSRITPAQPLMSLEDTKIWFGVSGSSLDPQLTLVGDAVSDSIRSYVGRYLTFGEYQEKFEILDNEDRIVYAREYPVTDITSGGSVINTFLGKVQIDSDQITYHAGYSVLPSALTLIYYDVVRQQMAAMGYSPLGTSSVVGSDPATKAVTIGSMKIEYAVPVIRTDEARGTGGLINDALAPYSALLDNFRSNRIMAST